MSRLSVNIAGVTFKNPVITASGCCGFGREYDKLYPMEKLGGVSLKGITPLERQGNPPCRVAETPAGMLNSVGLQNPGVDAFLRDELPGIANRDIVRIANVAGASVDDYRLMAEKLDESAVSIIEVNISCPNVKEGGVAFGISCQSAVAVVAAMRGATKKPLMVKLTPNVTDITEIARAVEDAGADAVSLINTLLGMRIDLKTRRPVLHQNVGGLSGPAVFPVAVRMVWQVANAVKIPVVGMGGIEKWQDAVEMMLAGARAVQIGAALFADPYTPLKVIDGMNRWLDENHIADVNEIVGAVKPW
ncbi:dihydroorotate dehydrogenase [Anaerotruncus rubiinfantis]|uniref:dihydroorotate dehydrogenase n=1 Tax=Anaerotruncus rubiinfantis TaxID=1720200 RepID=UPI0018998798|nr:dihydroorotate dehydrogenase [Anaerotruncus rubiinfantis]